MRHWIKYIKRISVFQFPFVPIQPNVVGTEKNRLDETVLLCTTTSVLLLKRQNGDVNCSVKFLATLFISNY